LFFGTKYVARFINKNKQLVDRDRQNKALNKLPSVLPLAVIKLLTRLYHSFNFLRVNYQTI